MTQMVPDRLHGIFRLIVAAVLIFSFPVPTWAQRNSQPLAKPFRGNVALPVDSNLLKRFGTAEDLLADQRWTEAIAILQEIAQTDNKGLVKVESGSAGRNMATFLNVATRCNILMSRISREGLVGYRQKSDPQAKRWFENWQRTRDETELMRIVRQAYLSNFGDDALMALGEAAWDRGDFSTARQWWQQLVPLPKDALPEDYPTVLRFPDAEMSQPEILARLALCSVLEKETIRAEEEVRQFGDRYPLAEGSIGGQHGRLAELLQRELDHSRHWHVVKHDAEIETFAISPTRFRLIPESLDVGALRWARPLPANVLPHPVEGFPFHAEPLSYHPVVYDKFVLVNDADSIRAWNVMTGDPAWPSIHNDPAIIYPTVAEDASPVPEKMCVGVPHFTMSISDHRLYARMGSPVTCASTLPQRDLQSDLVCLDLTQEGKLIWKIPSGRLLNDGSWRFEGTPLIVSGRAYVTLCRRRPQLELTVACLDAADGRLLWQRPVGGFLASVDENHNRVSHLLLTAGGGRIFLSTDVGAIVALDAADGRFEWVLAYESRVDDPPAVQSDPGQRGLLPAMYYNGWLIVAPNDSESAFCIEADSGRVHWRYSYITNSTQDVPEFIKRDVQGRQRRDNQWQYLLGVAANGTTGRLIASGKSLVAIDIESGLKIWETPRSAFGRGVLAGDQVLVPGRTSIEFCSQQTGQLIRSVPLKTAEASQQGGNLTLAGGMLMVAQPKRLVAYSEFSQLKERIERELTLRPYDPKLLIQLGELENAEGVPEAAERAFQQILDHVDPLHPDYLAAQRKIIKLWQVAGKKAFDAEDFSSARDNWMRTLTATEDPTQRLEVIFQLASVDVKLNLPDEAVAQLQSILDDELLASFPLNEATAGDLAASKIAGLIEEYGHQVYSQIELTAAKRLEEFQANANPTELRQLVRKYPHASIITTAQQQLAQFHRRLGEVPEAYAVLDGIRHQAIGEAAYIQATLDVIELLEDAKETNAAKRLWQSLSTFDPTTEVKFAGVQDSLRKLLATHDAPTEAAGTRPFNIERTWNHPLPSDAAVIVPENAPPAPEHSCLLVCAKHARIANTWSWRCIDDRTGQIRWEETASKPILKSRWTAVHLLIGTANGWQARAPENGRRVWAHATGPLDSTPVFAIQSTEHGEEIAWPTSFDPDRGFQLFDPNDGRVTSRIKPPSRMHAHFTIGSPAQLGFSKQKSTKPVEQGRGDALVPTWTDPSLMAFFQTSRPTRTWMAVTSSPKKPWSIHEIGNGAQPWQQTPFGVRNRIVGLTRENHLLAYEAIATDAQTIKTDLKPKSSMNEPPAGESDANAEIVEFLHRAKSIGSAVNFDDSSNEVLLRRAENNPGHDLKALERVASQWSYHNFAMGLALPFAWSQNGELLALSDGTLLMSFNPANGARKWTVGLADFPLQNPAQQICLIGDTVFATSQGYLRAVNAASGRSKYERYLGEVYTQSRTSVAWQPRKVMAAPGPTRNDPPTALREGLLAIWSLGGSQIHGSTILLCDAEKGDITQRLSVDAEPRSIVINQNGVGMVWTEKSVSGLQTIPE